jgi:hypothetical protein
MPHAARQLPSWLTYNVRQRYFVMKIKVTPKKMYWRVIVRFSLSRDRGSTVRNLVITKLKAVGLRNTKTGVWESGYCEMVPATKMLTDVIKELSKISASWSSGGPYLNHLWVYIDYRKKSLIPTLRSNT